jgi:hypothetical protein
MNANVSNVPWTVSTSPSAPTTYTSAATVLSNTGATR